MPQHVKANQYLYRTEFGNFLLWTGSARETNRARTLLHEIAAADQVTRRHMPPQSPC